MSQQNFYQSYYEDPKQKNHPPRIPNYSNESSVQSINHSNPQLTGLLAKDTEISVFNDGVYITHQSGGWLPVYRSERRQFLPLKHISSFTWGFAPNKPLIIFFIMVFVVFGGLIGYSSQSCYYGCSPIGGGAIGVIVGFIVGIGIVSVSSKSFRHFEFVIQCDGDKFEFYPGSSSVQSQIIHIVEILRLLKYYELTLQTNPSVNQPSNPNPPMPTRYPNVPTGYPNAPKG